jgi:hypothetical protein
MYKKDSEFKISICLLTLCAKLGINDDNLTSQQRIYRSTLSIVGHQQALDAALPLYCFKIKFIDRQVELSVHCFDQCWRVICNLKFHIWVNSNTYIWIPLCPWGHLYTVYLEDVYVTAGVQVKSATLIRYVLYCCILGEGWRVAAQWRGWVAS